MRNSFAVLGLGVLIWSAPAMAQSLDVKPGLWEITGAGMSGPNKVCYTAESLNASLAQVPMPPGIECKNEVTQHTAKVVVTHTVCTGIMAVDGETRVDVKSPEAMTMQSSMVMTMGGTKQPINTTANYAWLTSECGDVKPFDPTTLFSAKKPAP